MKPEQQLINFTQQSLSYKTDSSCNIQEIFSLCERDSSWSWSQRAAIVPKLQQINSNSHVLI
jgi:hypothetical protein